MRKEKRDIKAFLLSQVEVHPSELVQIAANHFNVSIQAVQKHISKLLKSGLLVKTGNTRNTRYSLPKETNFLNVNQDKNSLETGASANWKYDVTKKLSEQEVWDNTLKPLLKMTSESVREIVEYGFTEMVNNVIDHSSAKELNTSYSIIQNKLQIVVLDNGMGIFKKIKDTLGLETLRESILHLSKGKLTTDHTKHTGEGIFFSSRVFDNFFISANGLVYGRINDSADEDWLIGDQREATIGTRVEMKLNLNSKRTREEVFKRFTSPEDFSFSKTHVAVELGINDGETYVSRSQAKRILSGLEKFKFIVLNFKRVNTVGQGFVDEVFRVFKNSHPEIQISSINTNESVAFMIQRSGVI